MITIWHFENKEVLAFSHLMKWCTHFFKLTEPKIRLLVTHHMWEHIVDTQADHLIIGSAKALHTYCAYHRKVRARKAWRQQLNFLKQNYLLKPCMKVKSSDQKFKEKKISVLAFNNFKRAKSKLCKLWRNFRILPPSKSNYSNWCSKHVSKT